MPPTTLAMVEGGKKGGSDGLEVEEVPVPGLWGLEGCRGLNDCRIYYWEEWCLGNCEELWLERSQVLRRR